MLAPAKLNLSLEVTGKRPDGYHLLKSEVVFLKLADKVEIEESAEFSLRIFGPMAASAPLTQNILEKTWNTFKSRFSLSGGVSVHLEKHIPSGAGLGGASADAAALLKLLSARHNLPIPADLALSLGADVPACLASPGRFLMEGIGEKLTPLPPSPYRFLLLAHPGEPLSTSEVFGEFRPQDPNSGNHLEPAAIRLMPQIGEVLSALKSLPGCKQARMSGSGSVCFGVFPDEALAARAQKALKSAREEWWIEKTEIASG